MKALNDELYNVNDALSILCSVAKSQDSDSDAVRSDAEAPPGHAGSLDDALGLCEVVTLGILPSSAAAEHLIALFLNQIEPFFPFVRRLFPDTYELVSQCGLLMAQICAIASRYSPFIDLRRQETALRSHAHAKLDEAMTSACLLPSGQRVDRLVWESLLVILLDLEWPGTRFRDRPLSLEQYNQSGLLQLAIGGKLAEISGVLQNNAPIYIAMNMLDQVVAARLCVKSALSFENPESSIDEAMTSACLLPSGQRVDRLVWESLLVILLDLEWPGTRFRDRPLSLEQYNQSGLLQLAIGGKLAEISGVLQNNAPIYIAMNMLDQVVAARLCVKSALSFENPESSIVAQMSAHDRARVSVLRLLALASRTLFSSRETTRKIVSDGSFFSMLKLIHPQFEQWLLDFRDIAADPSWAARCVMFEFNHCRLYVYSLVNTPGLVGLENSPEALSEATQYLRIAVDAAAAIIDFETSQENPVSLQLGPPMRWIVRFIHASVFLAKSLVSPNATWYPELRPTLFEKVAQAARAMEAAGPHNFQLMGHYTQILKRVKDQIHGEDLVNARPDQQRESVEPPPLELDYEATYPLDELALGPIENDYALAEVDRTLLYMLGSPESAPFVP